MHLILCNLNYFLIKFEINNPKHAVNTLILITVNDDIKSNGNNKVTLKYKTILYNTNSKIDFYIT